MILHCNSKPDEKHQVAANAPLLAGQALARANAALAARKTAQPLDRQAARAELDDLIAGIGAPIA
jgi:beta-N-acetylhexosaminidase